MYFSARIAYNARASKGISIMADTPVETGAEAGGAGMPQRFLDLPEPDFLARGALVVIPYFVPRGVATDWRAVLAERQHHYK
jgi:hypothetical protein